MLCGYSKFHENKLVHVVRYVYEHFHRENTSPYFFFSFSFCRCYYVLVTKKTDKKTYILCVAKYEYAFTFFLGRSELLYCCEYFEF